MRPAFALLLLISVSAFGDTLYTISDASSGNLVIQFHAPSSTAGDLSNLSISNYGAWAPYSTDLSLDTTTTVSYFEMDGWNTAGPVLTSGLLSMVEPWPAGCLTHPQTVGGCDSDGETYSVDFQFFAAGLNGSPGDGEYAGLMGREGLNSAVNLSVVDPPSSVPEPASAGLVLVALAGLLILARRKKMLA